MSETKLEATAFENPAETMRDVMARLGHHDTIEMPEALDLTKAHLVTVPEKRRVEDLSRYHREAAEYLKPARRKGTARLADLASLIDWANRFKGPTTAMFANPDMAAPTLTCIADYHAGGAVDLSNAEGDPTAMPCNHRGVYDFPLSDEWKIWMAASGQQMDKDEFGEFIEANAKDIMDPTPPVLQLKLSEENQSWENRLIDTAQQIEGRYGQLTQLLAMSKKFQVFETSDLKVTSNRDTGEAEIQFLNEHKDADGKPLNIPNLIIIAIPVFLSGAAYRMPVRVRYRKNGAALKFTLTIYNPKKSFDASFDETIAQAKEETDLPIFMGKPES